MYNGKNERSGIMSDKKKTYKLSQSLDNLNDYIRVVNPSVWFVLVAMLSIVIGMICWSFLGNVERTIETTINIENNQAVCYINVDDVNEVQEGMKITFDGKQAWIEELEETDGQIAIYTISLDSKVKSGHYEGSIVVEEISPISFLLD